MSMRMLIDARHPEETRVAVVKGNRIEEFDFEAAAKKQLKGNIYLAKVTRVEPSLQAAFIEYGGNRHGFLAFSEIHPDYYQIPKEDRDALLREEREAAEAAARADEHHHDEHDVDAHPEADHAEGDEEAPRPAPEEAGATDDSATEALRRKRQALRRRYKIQEVIHRRQVMLVQVVKEERGNKGAALTTYLSLAGRYCVLMPNTAHGGGISRKISNPADRKRLKSIIAEMKLPSSMACIVRTAGLSRTKAEIKRDFDYLTRLWDDIRDATMQSTAPALVHQDSDLIKRAIRDVYTREIDQVLVEGEEGYKAAKGFMKLLMPSHAKKVQQYEDPVPLFQRAGVESQLAAMYNPVVQLRSGGYIVINPTEALVSIDINSGRSTREHDIEGTALKTNLEAADEIARQLRLRDMAGLVVIDFIDMESSGNTRKVEKAMKEALKNDRARIQVGRISSFGLMEMSRQRLRTGVLEATTHTCPMCDGAGVVRSVPSAALAALRGLEEEALRGKHCQFTLRAASDVAVYVLNRKRAEIVELEDRYGIAIDVVPDEALIVPHFAIEAAGGAPARPVIAAAMLPAPVPIDDDEDEVAEEIEGEEAEETAGEERRERAPRSDEDRDERNGRRGRRRRRRRGGRREDAAAEGAEAVETEAGDELEDGNEGAEGVVGEAEGDAETRAEAEGRRRRRRGRRGGRRRDERPEAEVTNADEATAVDAPDEVAAAPVEAPAEIAMPSEVDADATAPESVAEAPAKPKRTRRPRKAVEAEAAPAEAAPAEAASEATPEAGAEAPAKPKRTRRTPARKKAGEAEAPTADAAAAIPVDEAVAAPVAVAATEAAPAPEPALAQATADVAPANDSEPAGPAPAPRKGWWQRTFGN
jgi:ribonuclease E